MNSTDKQVEEYLTALRRALKGLPAAERDDFVSEISVHFRDALSEGAAGRAYLHGCFKAHLSSASRPLGRCRRFRFWVLRAGSLSRGVGWGEGTGSPVHELLGWWYIPLGLIIGALFLWGTTIVVRKLAKHVKLRRTRRGNNEASQLIVAAIHD